MTKASRVVMWLTALAVPVLMLAAPFSVSAVDFFGGLCDEDGVNAAACSGDGQDNLSGTEGIILRAAALLSIIAGIAAVIMIIVAGVMFITAGGDSNKISTAKRTVIYAIVGLAVIALARTIVVFVIGNI